MKNITLILNKIIGIANCMILTRFINLSLLTVNLLIIIVSFILFILQIDCCFLNENLMTYSTNGYANNWLYDYILQDEQDLTNFNEKLNNNNLLRSTDLGDSEINQCSATIADQNKTEAEYSDKHKAEDINDKKESKTDSNNKYHYIIGIVISVLVIGMVWYYFTSVNVEDSTDTSSYGFADSISSATILGSEASTALSTSSTETLLNQTYSQFYFNIANFRNALESMSYQQLYLYIPNFGNGYNLSIDYQLLNFLRERAEAETLDFQRLFSVMGEAPINIFRNHTNLAIFNTLWQPSDAYPTFISFVNHICDEYAEYLMLVDLEID